MCTYGLQLQLMGLRSVLSDGPICEGPISGAGYTEPSGYKRDSATVHEVGDCHDLTAQRFFSAFIHQSRRSRDWSHVPMMRLMCPDARLMRLMR